MKSLAPFYPVVPDAAWVERLVAAGARLIQLRVKDQPIEVVQAAVRQARDRCRAADATLVVNDYWDVALEEGCTFVHLGQEDLETAELGRLRAAGIRFGISTHSDAELRRALEADPDYVALGPIYPTTLKQMPWAPQGLQRIAEWRRRIGARPLVAIGGITAETAPLCLAAGADCVAVVGDIVRHADPEGRAREWLRVTGGSDG